MNDLQTNEEWMGLFMELASSSHLIREVLHKFQPFTCLHFFIFALLMFHLT